MIRPTRRFLAAAALLSAATMVTAAAVPDSTPFHERKEVAGLAVVFGAEPEPALTDESQSLMWRVSTLDTEEAYADMKSAQVTISRNGTSLGSFEVRPVRRTPGEYQTRHIFTEAGEYSSVLSFKKGDAAEVHTVDFNFNIANRSTIEIPRRRGGR